MVRHRLALGIAIVHIDCRVVVGRKGFATSSCYCSLKARKVAQLIEARNQRSRRDDRFEGMRV